MAGAIDRFVCSDDGVRLAVRDFGGNGQPLVLIHGYFGNLGQFDTIAPMLTEHYRVVAYDQRGHGWSESGSTSVGTYVDDLRAVTDALKLEVPVLYGSSFGALIALAYLHVGGAARAFVNEDGRVSDWPPEGPGPAPQPDGPRILDADEQQAHLDLSTRAGPAGAALATRSMQALRDGRVELRPTQTELNAKALAFSELPILDCYRSIDVPVLVLSASGEGGEQAERDRAIEQLLAVRSCDVRPFATGHWITAQDPSAVASVLAEFSQAL